jgi:hypothetical protein
MNTFLHQIKDTLELLVSLLNVGGGMEKGIEII